MRKSKLGKALSTLGTNLKDLKAIQDQTKDGSHLRPNNRVTIRVPVM